VLICDEIDIKVKKRKLSEPPPAKNTPAAKKSVIASATSSKAVVKKEAKPPILTAVKDAKSDSSFFSAPKPKAKLPSFKKAPVSASIIKKEQPDPSVAQPSSIDPFQEVLKSMKARKDSPVVSTPPPTSTAPAPVNTTKPGKKRKSVTWAPDNQLESIKLIDRAVYDDDPMEVSSSLTCSAVRTSDSRFTWQGTHSIHSLRDLDRGEGAALHAHLFEEAIDWAEPIGKELLHHWAHATSS
jgi:protein phosphatase 1 regulatory subunit 10